MKSNRIFLKSAFLGYINMFVVMFIGIISQPLMLNQLGSIEFGIWTITLNILSYIGNTNVGIPGAALVSIAKSKSETVKRNIVIKSLKLLSLLSIIISVLFLLFILISPNWFLIMGKIDVEFYNIAKYTMLISIILFLIRSPLQLAQSVFSGYQDIHINKVYELLNSIVPFLALLLIIIIDKSVVYLALFSGVGYIVVNMISTIHMIYKYKIFTEVKEDININEDIKYKNLLVSGAEFFFIGIGAALIYSTDSLVISNFVGVYKIPNYNFAFKLYQMSVQVMNIFTGISMPLYGSAFAKNDYKWIKKIYTNMVTLFPIFAGAIWIGGMLIGRDILEVWANDKGIFENYSLLFILGAFVYSLSIVNINSTFLSGIDKKRESAKLIWVESVLNLILSIIFCKFMGITGVALGTLLSSITVPFILLPRYVKKHTHSNIIFNFKNMFKHLFIGVAPFLIVICIFTNIIYNTNIIIKIILVLIVMSSYLFVSYILLENEMKEELKRILINKLKNE